MAIKTALVPATTTATAVTTTEEDNMIGQGFAFKNTGSTTVYLGGEDVTSENGWPLAAGETLALDGASAGDVPYLVTDSGTSDVIVLRTGA